MSSSLWFLQFHRSIISKCIESHGLYVLLQALDLFISYSVNHWYNIFCFNCHCQFPRDNLSWKYIHNARQIGKPILCININYTRAPCSIRNLRRAFTFKNIFSLSEKSSLWVVTVYGLASYLDTYISHILDNSAFWCCKPLFM